MKKHFQLMIISAALLSFTACDNKKDMDDEDPMDETTITPAPTDDNTTIIIDGGKDGGIEVDSKPGTDVSIDVNKKGGSVTVDDGGNKIDVKVKEDPKK